MIRLLALVVLALAVACGSAAAQSPERRVALVIGNSAYERAPRLPNPGADSRAVAAALGRLGFEVRLHLDLTRPKMTDALVEFEDRARGAALALVFFAGHAMQAVVSGRGESENLLVPIEAGLLDERRVEDETVPLRRVLAAVEGARQRIVILDACRDNPLLVQMRRREAGRSAVTRGLGQVQSGGTLLVFSTDPGQVALDGTGSNSPFTVALLPQLESPGLEFRVAMTRVRAAVLAATGGRQRPWVHDGMDGEVYLAGLPSAVAALPPSAAPIPPSPAVDPLDRALIANTGVNVREQPDVQARAVAELKAGQSVHVLGRLRGENWYLVQLDRNVQGYVASNLLEDETVWKKRTEIAAVTPPATPPRPEPRRGLPPDFDLNSVLKNLSKNRDCAECPEMVVIPGGTFTMGSPASEEGRFDWEGPQRRVTVGPFAAGKYEVTFAEWDACAAAGGCTSRPSDNSWGRDRRPVINVSWSDSQEYVRWLSRRTGKQYRLLSEAEWEYAARAVTTTARPWGEGIGNGNANCDRCGSQWDKRQTAPVGSFRPNSLGLYDVIGNVWEWVEDCWNLNYSDAPSDSRAWLSGNCSGRVVRGGSWDGGPRSSRSASRGREPPDDRFVYVGFRVARSN